MKKNIILSVLSLLVITMCVAKPANDENKIKKVITGFSAYADSQDSANMHKLLDSNFRSVVNRLFGGKDISIMDKNMYLEMLSSKKIGGDQREVKIVSIDITNNNAMVKAQFLGKKMEFTSYISLVKDDAGNWTIINDNPHIVPKG